MTGIGLRQTKHRLAQYLVASVISLAVIESAFAADEGLTKQCAVRDLQILTSLERRDASLVPQEELRAETFVLQEARRLCALHLIPEALAVYDRVQFNSKPISEASFK